MNRCTPHRLALPFLLTIAALAATVSLPAGAQNAAGFKPGIRTFPAAALRGELAVVAPPTITLDGKPDRLSPGSRIRDVNNMLVMSAALVGKPVVVNYLRESGGNVHEVWILNPEEARLKRPNSKASWFSFGSGADVVPPPVTAPVTAN